MKISVIAPFYNEEEAISDFIKDIESSLHTSKEYEWEFIFVDDGSSDKTSEIIRSHNLPNLKIISTPHLGLSNALFTGISHSNGDIIATIDTDGQFLFKDVLRFIEILIKENADIVTGYRVRRDDNIVRIISSRLANFIKRIVLSDRIRDSTCTLKVFKKEVKDKILYRFDGFHRFIPSFALINGLKLIEEPIEHRNRERGLSKFGILNRFPDVLIDVLGVKWLQYKRFSLDADERRFSFYPDLLFLILFVYLFLGLFGGYFKVVDDFWLYGSLNRFIGFDYSKSYGWENFIFNEIVPPMIRIIYAFIMKIGKIIGVLYPLEWANKITGLSTTLLSYILLNKLFALHFKKNHSKWISLLIIFWGISSSEIYSGLARSSSYVLIPLLLTYTYNLSTLMFSIITFFTALLYPVLLPLFFLYVIFVYLFCNLKKAYLSIIPVLSGILGLVPMILKIDLTSFSPSKEGDMFLKETAIFDLPASSNFNLLFGFTENINLVEWINFNFLHQWMLNDELRNIIGLFIPLFILLGILRRLIKENKDRVDVIAFMFTILFFIVGFFKREYTDASYVFKWGVLFSSLYVITGILTISTIKRHQNIFLLSISSLLAFLITHILSRKVGFGVHEPGRQLQRAFMLIFPFVAVAHYHIVYKNSENIKRVFVILPLCVVGILYFPQLKLVSPQDKYVIQRIQGLPDKSIVLSHPLTANWIVTHTNKYSTIIDEQIRATKTNPIRGSGETIMPTEMAAIIMGIYYGSDINKAKDWCNNYSSDGYILVEEYYFSERFFNLHRDPYISFIERNNPERSFALLNLPLYMRHPITPEAFIISCRELTNI